MVAQRRTPPHMANKTKKYLVAKHRGSKEENCGANKEQRESQAKTKKTKRKQRKVGHGQVTGNSSPSRATKCTGQDQGTTKSIWRVKKHAIGHS